MKKLRVGVVGLGNIAMVHVRSLIGFDDVSLRVICDTDPVAVKRIKTKFRIAKDYRDYEEMAERSDVDCVFVLTPSHTHAQISSVFLENGKHVFCEKPLAFKLREVEDVVKKAKKHGRRLMMGFNRRFTPVYQKAKDLFGQVAPEICITHKHKNITGVRSLVNDQIHMIDLLRWFCGKPNQISCQSMFRDPSREETVAAIIGFDSGAVGIHVCNYHSGGWSEGAELCGGECTVVVDAPQTATILRQESKEVYRPAALVFGFSAPGWIDLIDAFGFRQEDRHFIDCLKKDIEPLTGGEDALETHRLVDVIYSKSGLPGLK